MSLVLVLFEKVHGILIPFNGVLFDGCIPEFGVLESVFD